MSMKMEEIVLMMTPVNPYLEDQLNKRFNLVRLWTVPNQVEFLTQNANMVRAIVVIPTTMVDADLIDSLPRLEIVASYSVGLDKIDLARVKERGIRVTNTPDVLTADVTDLALGLMLAVLGRVPQCDHFVRGGLWIKGDFPLNSKFSGKTVGIIGLGRIGAAIAKRVAAFGCPIAYHSRTEKRDFHYTYYPSVTELASKCDILVVACSLTQETRNIINRDVLDALGSRGFLINIGRGAHVDETELVAALTEGRIAGAGLDVFPNEPCVSEVLFKLDNVVLTPHIGTATIETRTAMADLVLGNLEAHFCGKPLLTPVV